MLTVERALLIITSVKTCVLIGKPKTRHAIAKNISSVSRSTVYRLVNRMVELGLLIDRENKKGDMSVYITHRGKELVESSKELF